MHTYTQFGISVKPKLFMVLYIHFYANVGRHQIPGLNFSQTYNDSISSYAIITSHRQEQKKTRTSLSTLNLNTQAATICELIYTLPYQRKFLMHCRYHNQYI